MATGSSHYGGVIYGLSSGGIGASIDYRRERFTMDEGYVRAVLACSSTSRARLPLPRPTASSTGAHAARARSPTSRSITPTSTTSVLHDPLSARRRIGPHHDRHRTPGRPCSQTLPSPCTPMTSATGAHRKGGDRPVVERRVPIVADDRVEPEFGTGAAQGHAGSRSDGLRDRACPRPSGADGHRPRRAS